jgi:predicted transposase YbfD/YdcC
VRIESERHHKATGKTESEIRYYITSVAPDAARLNRCIRQHWGIENKLHRVLDVGFGEDLDRKRAGNAAQNFSVLNRIGYLRQRSSERLASPRVATSRGFEAGPFLLWRRRRGLSWFR